MQAKAARDDILPSLRHELPWLEVPDGYALNTDALDSLIAALTARAAAQNLTRHEGWIHLPTAFPFP